MKIVKKIIAMLMITVFVIYPPFVYATEIIARPTSGYGGVTFENMGDRVKITQTKKYPVAVYDPNKGKNVAKQVSKISEVIKSPKTATMAKNLAKGVGRGLIALALYDALGKAVDYVIDPENNSVKFKEPVGFAWKVANTESGGKKIFSSKEQGADYNCFYAYGVPHKKLRDLNGGNAYEIICENDKFAWTVEKVPDTKNKEMTLEEIAQMIKDLANKGNETAQDFITDNAKEEFEKGDYDSDLKANEKDVTDTEKDTNPKCGPGTHSNGSHCVPDDKPTDPKKTFELPAFCQWTGICPAWLNTEKNTKDTEKNTKEIEKTTKKQLEEEQSFFKDVRDFFKEPKKEEQKQTPIEEVKQNIDWQSKATNSYVRFGGSCPAPVSIPIQFMGASQNLTISYVPFCDFATKIRPAVILGAWIAGLMIISGGRTKE